jgi:lysozyme
MSCWRSLLIALLTMGLLAGGPARAQAPPADPAGTSAAELGLTDLSNDLSRQQLFDEMKLADSGSPDVNLAAQAAQSFSLYGPFRFPADVDFDAVLVRKRPPSVFGVDISHHTAGHFPLEQLRVRKVHFLYMKATQGATYLDPRFAYFWQRSGRLAKGTEVHRGAYHFLSSGDPAMDGEEWGKAQARTFIKVVKANGGLRPTDMPPVVDLEWDKASKDGPDRWSGRSPDDIFRVVLAFVTTVEAELQRTPMIYTAASWWRERMGAQTDAAPLARYPMWVADYSRTSRASETPRSIKGANWHLWQFTDGATMSIGFNDAFDANIFAGSIEQFYRALGVTEF